MFTPKAQESFLAPHKNKTLVFCGPPFLGSETSSRLECLELPLAAAIEKVQVLSEEAAQSLWRDGQWGEHESGCFLGFV